MHNKTGVIKICFISNIIVFVLSILCMPVFAQTDTAKQQIDSIKLSKFNTDSVKKYFRASDTLIAYQLQKIERYTINFNAINNKLRRGLNVATIRDGLPQSDSIISIAKTNLKGMRGYASLKILTTTKTILQHHKSQLEQWQNTLTGYNNDLNSIKDQMLLIKSDSNLLVMPSDSLLFNEYIKKLQPLGLKITAADSASTDQLKTLGILQNSVSSNFLTVTNLLDEANFQISNFSNRLLENEFGYIWDYERDPSYKTDFRNVATQSLKESKILLGFYTASNVAGRLIVLFIGIFFLWLMARSKRKIIANNEAPESVLDKARHIPRHLFASAIVFSLMLIPFVYKAAPQAFTQSLWIVQTIALVILMRKKLNYAMGIQIFILLCLFYIAGFANLLIETTYAERWIQLFISTISILLGVWILATQKKNYFSGNTVFKPLIVLFIFMNSAALFLNIMGRVTLAKVLNTGANYGLIEAINLVVFLEIIIDAVYLLGETGKRNSRLTSYFEFENLDEKIRKGLGFFALLFWLVIFTQSLHLYDFIFGSIASFLSTVQHMGDMTFTFGSIGIFILILWISALISRIVSFLFGTQNISTARNADSKLGSTLLLVRLGILSAGLLLAFAASGIPLDKLAIIIGALGVGIGFGLQTIVNNLVSGIVLAFEKPVQIGDIIEVGERSGTVKEIGIRSSKLTTFDGSEVIIPNGDMLSQHLINWTRNNEHRRVMVSVGVAYHSDLQQVKKIILDVVNQHKDVFNFPEPFIRVSAFGDSSVDIKVYFWAEMERWFDLKSDMMFAIFERLKEDNISIPFPQRDLHIKSIDQTILTVRNSKQ